MPPLSCSWSWYLSQHRTELRHSSALPASQGYPMSPDVEFARVEFLWLEVDRVQKQAPNSLPWSHPSRIVRQLVFWAYSKILGMLFYVCGHKMKMCLVCEWEECKPFSFKSCISEYFPISLQQTRTSLWLSEERLALKRSAEGMLSDYGSRV